MQGDKLDRQPIAAGLRPFHEELAKRHGRSMLTGGGPAESFPERIDKALRDSRTIGRWEPRRGRKTKQQRPAGVQPDPMDRCGGMTPMERQCFVVHDDRFAQVSGPVRVLVKDGKPANQ